MPALLVKDAIETVLVPAVPARASVPAVSFQMYAPPLPAGYTYNQYKSGGILYPNSAATFANWSQLKVAPTEYFNTIAGYDFRTLASLVAQYGPSFSPDASWIPRYATLTGPGGPYTALTGFDVPRIVANPLPPRYYGPIQHMTFVTFSGVPVASNGYPLGDGPFTGSFDVPTLDGLVRVTSVYDKDFRGVLLRRTSPALPAYCTQSGACRVVMLSGFPGRAAVDAVAAVLSVDDRSGWNAGGNSILALDTDCETVFTPEITAAGAVGFAPSGRADVTKFENLTHAFYFDQAAGGFPQFAVIERGLRVWGPRRLTPTMEFKLARVSGIVTFSVDGVPVYQSPTYLPGEIIVGTALYRAGDGVL